IDLGRTLGLETLGEGIEDLEQLRALQRARCDSGQGFLLGPPATPDQIRVLLGDHRPGQPLPAAADA
ncbi:MAG: diguanylate phosphodiesterase, partial [Solirubrobacteraceae bacterium]